MIRASATLNDGRRIYILGITAENVRRLQKGQPIKVALEPLGGKGEVFITFGETEVEIAADLASVADLSSAGNA